MYVDANVTLLYPFLVHRTCVSNKPTATSRPPSSNESVKPPKPTQTLAFKTGHEPEVTQRYSIQK
jgi:hypothetical protein